MSKRNISPCEGSCRRRSLNGLYDRFNGVDLPEATHYANPGTFALRTHGCTLTSRSIPMTTIKVGVREFRERIASFLESDTPVAVTRRGENFRTEGSSGPSCQCTRGC